TFATGDTVNLPGTVFDLEVSGGYAYVVYSSGFRILDISTIGSPILIASFSVGGLQDVELIGEFAFVSGFNVLEIYNAQAPLTVSSPYLAKTIRTPAIGLRSAAAGSQVAFGTSSGFSMIDVSVFAATVTDAPIGGIGANEYLVNVDDGVAYLTDDTGLAAYDTTGATSFSLMGEVMTAGLVYDMAVSGDVVYVGTVPSPELRIFRYASGTGYTQIASVDTGEPYGVVVHGDHAFVPVANGVKIVDITDPDNAAITSELTVAPVNDMVAVEDRSYTVVSGAGLLIHDITNPESPELLNTLFYTEDNGVAVGGDYAVIWNAGGATLLNIARPAENLNYTVTVTGIFEMQFVGDLIFASTNAGLEIVDYSDLSNISVIRTVTDAGGLFRVFPTGRFLYAMSGYTGPEQRVLTWVVP
ncbi:MAG: hypothetical protein V3S41_08595, partial [Spirochaetia bacterium]